MTVYIGRPVVDRRKEEPELMTKDRGRLAEQGACIKLKKKKKRTVIIKVKVYLRVGKIEIYRCSNNNDKNA